MTIGKTLIEIADGIGINADDVLGLSGSKINFLFLLSLTVLVFLALLMKFKKKIIDK